MEYNDTNDDNWYPNYNSSAPENGGIYFSGLYVTTAFTILISLAGLVGNGLVLWLLGFHTKKNSFTVYVLNLSIADFCVLASLIGINICWLFIFSCPGFLLECFHGAFSCMFSTSQFLLMVISIDRCVCLYFPLWHKCRRPPHLSTIICIVTWMFNFLIFATPILTLFSPGANYISLKEYPFLVNAMLFTPVMASSTLAMAIKVCVMSPRHRKGRILTVVLLALVLFLLFAFPMNFVEYFYFYSSYFEVYLYEYGLITASLNSTVNPLIYFLIGRRKMGQSRARVKKILEKLFVEEENCGATLEPTLQTEL